LLDIDVQGAAQIKQKMPDAVSVFVLPPSREELELRLRRRSQAEHMISEDVIQRRLHTASKEIENWPKYDYILVNDRLEYSIDQLKAIVLCERVSASEWGGQCKTLAEPCRKANAAERLKPILASFAAQPAEQVRSK
jgi:guanylate kinase